MNCRCASGGGHLPFSLKSSRPLPSRSARHPPPKWGWARKTWRRGAINPKPCLPLLAGGGGPRLYLKPCLPPLAGGRGTASLLQILPPPRLQGGGGPRSGGRGVFQAVDACEAGIRTLSKERVPSNIKGHPPSFTIALMPPSVSLRSPPTPKWGWARKTWRPPSVSLRSPPTP